MKKYIYTAILAVILGLSISLYIAILNNNKYREDIELYDNNFKALNLKCDSLNNEAIAYKFEVEQLEYINDSIINKLNESRKELKIKDKTIQQMHYVLTEGNIKDTVTFKDTVFRDNFVKIDTTLGDAWYSLDIKALTPTTISYDISYTSEIEMFAYKDKEYVGIPKKCFISRLFQKKQSVIRVEVKDNNPYARIKNKKFIILNNK